MFKNCQLLQQNIAEFIKSNVSIEDCAVIFTPKSCEFLDDDDVIKGLVKGILHKDGKWDWEQKLPIWTIFQRKRVLVKTFWLEKWKKKRRSFIFPNKLPVILVS